MIATIKIVRTLAAAGIAMAAVAGAAAAGECPADQMKSGAVMTGEMTPVGVTDTVIASIDLSPKGGDFKGNTMRLRKLVIAPGGVVPWHDHKVRPANIFVMSGEITEYRSNCQVPIVHKAGEVTAEFGDDLAHWWKNTGSTDVVLLSADILPPAMDAGMM
jgi:quercetin dioxygenase-like cupin family protein